jgi:hypothetical protein
MGIVKRGDETDAGPGPSLAFIGTEPDPSKSDSACAALIAGRNTIVWMYDSKGIVQMSMS